MHYMLWILQACPCMHVHRSARCSASSPQKKPAALASGLFCEVLDGDSYAITVLRQNVSAAVTCIFLVEVLDVLA